MPVTHDYCQKVRCGTISQAEAGAANLWDCSQHFEWGPMICPSGPTVQPLLPPVQHNPVPLPGIPVLTPQNIVQPLPDITQVATPCQEQECSFWSVVNAEIEKHPGWSVAILVGALLLFKGGRR